VSHDTFSVASRALNPPRSTAGDAAAEDVCLAVRVLVEGRPILQRRFPLPRGPAAAGMCAHCACFFFCTQPVRSRAGVDKCVRAVRLVK
jgi:hypothetical protein